MNRPATFTAVMKIAGINPYVDVPSRVVDGLGAGSKAAVRVKIAASAAGGARRTTARSPAGRTIAKDAERLKTIARLGRDGWFRTTLVPSKSSPTRLYLDSWMRGQAGVGVGDRVRVTLKPDSASRTLPVPAPLRAALEGNAGAKAAWSALAPSRRREMLSYINFLKTPAAIERAVQKVLARLTPRDGGD